MKSDTLLAFVFGFALALALMMFADWANTPEAQAGSVEEVLTIRVRPVLNDGTFTEEQNAQLQQMLGDLVMQVNTVNRGFSERLRQTLISGRKYHTSVHSNP